MTSFAIYRIGDVVFISPNEEPEVKDEGQITPVEGPVDTNAPPRAIALEGWTLR
jgi:hypothetical protein